MQTYLLKVKYNVFNVWLEFSCFRMTVLVGNTGLPGMERLNT